MNFDIILKLSYGIMIAAIILCFLLMKRQQRTLRLAVNRFAFAFVKISNHVSPRPPRQKLRLADGCAVALAEQPPALQEIITRAGEDEVVALYSELSDALDGVRRVCGRQKKPYRQFYEPLDGLFQMTRTFLVGCENLNNINSLERAEIFNNFLHGQVTHRKLLLRRISGDAGPEYASYNTRYDLTVVE